MKNTKKCIALLLSAAMIMQNTPVSVQASAKLSLNKTKLTLQEGGKTKLSVKGKNIKKCIYKSKNKKIAMVSKQGIVKAKKKGNTKICVTVTYKKAKETLKKKLWCKVIVKVKQERKATAAPSNTINPLVSNMPGGTLQPTQTAKVTLTGKPTGIPEVTSTSEPRVTPTGIPEVTPTSEPQVTPTGTPEIISTDEPQVTPTGTPEIISTDEPQVTPSEMPEVTPTGEPELPSTSTPVISQEPTQLPYQSLKEGGAIAAAGNIQWEKKQVTSDLFKYSLDETGQYARINGLSSTGKEEEELTIPAEIDGIPVYAVKNNAINGAADLQRLSISEGVKEMAVAAVSSCKKLQTISIPASLKLVTENAENPAERSECIFNKDTALQKVEVASENPWYQADENALYSKEGRNLIYWFSGGTQTDVKISEDVRCIEPQAFLGNSIVESISVPDQVREIGRDAFKNCYSLAKLTLPETLDYCGDNTFAGCESLAELHLPEGIEDLGNRIAGCLSLKKVYFPNSLKELTGGIQECDALEEVVISEDNPYLEADSMGCYSKGKEKLFYVFHASDLEEFIAPESLKEIGDGVFNSACVLKNVELKNVEKIGKSAFEGCGDLQNVNFGSRIRNIGQSAFGNCTGLTGITLPDEMELIEANAFYGCTALNKVEFQGTVQKIEGNAFGYCTSLESFKVPEGIEYMDSILEDCELLTKVTLSSTVRGFCYGEELDTEPFYNMNALQQIEVASGNPYLKTDGTALYTADGKILLYHCIGAEQESYDVEQGTEVIGEGAFKGPMFSSTVPALKEITLPDSLKEIRAGAFENAGLQQIVIPDSVQTIGDRAFSRCIYLGQVEIGKDSSLQEIGMAAFQNCRSMETIYIPAAVEKLGDSVFNLSDGLSEISYGGTKEEWKNLVPSYSSLGGNIQVTSIICSDGTVTPEDMGE